MTAIRGNIDRGGLPETAVLEFGGLTIYVLHDLSTLDLDPVKAGIRVVISGHTHKPSIREERGVLYLNPGSAGPRRFHYPISVAELEVVDGEPRARIVELPIS